MLLDLFTRLCLLTDTDMHTHKQTQRQRTHTRHRQRFTLWARMLDGDQLSGDLQNKFRFRLKQVINPTNRAWYGERSLQATGYLLQRT